MKKSIVLFFALVFCILSGACLTPKLYSSSNYKIAQKGTDVIKGLLLNDGNTAVLVGQNSQYRFSISSETKSEFVHNANQQLIFSRISLRPNDDITLVDALLWFKPTNSVMTQSQGETDNLITLRDGKEEPITQQTTTLLFTPKGMHESPITVYKPTLKLDGAEIAKKVVLTPFAVVGDVIIIAGVLIALPALYLLD